MTIGLMILLALRWQSDLMAIATDRMTTLIRGRDITLLNTPLKKLVNSSK
jgi:hypothetical protein